MAEMQIVNRGNTIEFYDPKKVEAYLNRYVPEGTNVNSLVGAVTEYVQLEDKVTSLKIQQELYSLVEGLISVQESFWQNVAGCIKADILRKEVFNNRGFTKGLKKVFELGEASYQYTNFYKTYTDEEIEELQEYIDNTRDYYVNHAGVHIVYDRYTTVQILKAEVNGKMITTGTKKIETLQERYMAISMFLHVNEPKEKRIQYVKEGYDAMSGVEVMVSMTPATPTFMNAGRPSGNLSSCFVGMVGDSIDDIYREAEQFAKVSKNAGGYQHA